MLQSLYIQNFALIEALDIEFGKGFSVITGETGAGKSIMLGAIGLLMGQRADARSIKKGASRCTVEGHFNISEDPHLADFFLHNELEYDKSECILRRELQQNGKSRAFINDTPVSLALMKELGEQLIDIHSQHQNLLLHKEDYQLEVLDLLSHTGELLQHYKMQYASYRDVSTRLAALQEEAEKSRADEDYLTFQLTQLDEATLKAGEEKSLHEESEVLSHASEIKEGLYRAGSLLEGGEGGVLSALKEAYSQLSNLTKVYAPAEELSNRIDSCYIELKDVAAEIEAATEQVEYNPARLEEVNDRLNLIYTLEQKHHVQTVEELLALAEDFRARLSTITSYDEHIAALSTEKDTLYKELLRIGGKLTESRKAGSVALEKELCSRLAPLGMPHVRFLAEITPRQEPGTSGCDRIRFLFNANKNGELQEVASVASGGEIARVMLVLKAMMASVSRMPTLIFDEIDTGVSGEIASRMAQIMQQMGEKMQVISITHLAQIAAGGAAHYFVYKQDGEESTSSHIRQLTPEERILELAHILSGATVTDAALTHAKELLKEYGTK